MFYNLEVKGFNCNDNVMYLLRNTFCLYLLRHQFMFKKAFRAGYLFILR